LIYFMIRRFHTAAGQTDDVCAPRLFARKRSSLGIREVLGYLIFFAFEGGDKYE